MPSMHDPRKSCSLGAQHGFTGGFSVNNIFHSIDLYSEKLHRSGKTVHDPLLSSKRHESLHSFFSRENQGGERGKRSVPGPRRSGAGGQALPTHVASGKRRRTFPSQTNPARTGSLLPAACQRSKSRRSSRAKPMEAQSSFPHPSARSHFHGGKCAKPELQILSSSGLFSFSSDH